MLAVEIGNCEIEQNGYINRVGSSARGASEFRG